MADHALNLDDFLSRFQLLRPRLRVMRSISGRRRCWCRSCAGRSPACC